MGGQFRISAPELVPPVKPHGGAPPATARHVTKSHCAATVRHEGAGAWRKLTAAKAHSSCTVGVFVKRCIACHVPPGSSPGRNRFSGATPPDRRGCVATVLQVSVGTPGSPARSIHPLAPRSARCLFAASEVPAGAAAVQTGAAAASALAQAPSSIRHPRGSTCRSGRVTPSKRTSFETSSASCFASHGKSEVRTHAPTTRAPNTVSQRSIDPLTPAAPPSTEGAARPLDEIYRFRRSFRVIRRRSCGPLRRSA